MDASLVSLTWIIPVITAFFLLFVNSQDQLKIKRLSALGAFINLGLVAYLCWNFYADLREPNPLDPASAFRFVSSVPWFSLLGINYQVGVDGISLLMVLLAVVVAVSSVYISWGISTQTKEFFIFLNLLVAGLIGSLVSLDLFTFLLFYELDTLPMYLLIGVWGSGRKEYAAMKLTLALVAGSALVFAGILALYFEAGRSTGVYSFNLITLSQVHFSRDFQMWAFPVLFTGFAILGVMFPFHTWSPDGHSSAPTAGSMLLAGVHMKLGSYGCLRVAMFLLPEGAREWMPFFLVLCTLNIVYGAFVAIRQTDLKYVIAYSSISHCGLIILGFCALTEVSLTGAVLQMVSHGFMTALFFGLIGMIYYRTHTRMLPELGGLMKPLPFLGVSLLIAGLAGLGLPGLSGFVTELTVFVGSFMNASLLVRGCTVLAVSSIVVTAVYVLRMVNAVMCGPVRNPEHAVLHDASLVEKVPAVLLMICLFGMGIFPQWMVKMAQAAVAPIYHNLQR